MSDYFAITLSYHNVAVSNLTAIYIFLLHLGSIGQHLQVHSLWGLKCLTSFFPWRFWVLNIAWKWGPPLLFFFWVFVLLSSLFSLCVGFSVHVAQQDFYYFKGYQFGDWYLSNFRFFGLSQGRHRKSWKMSPLQKVATNKNQQACFKVINYQKNRKKNIGTLLVIYLFRILWRSWANWLKHECM